MTEQYEHNQIIRWLREKKPCGGTKDDYYETFEDIPTLRQKLLEGKLPIDLGYSVDLIYVEKRKEEKDKEPSVEKIDVFYYTLFLVSTNKITDEKSDEKFGNIINSFRTRLLFYQFYFSRIAEPRNIRVIVVLPHYIDTPPEAIDKFFKFYKCGLWQIDINKATPSEIAVPEYLRGRMSKDFEESIEIPDDMGRTIRKISEKLEKDESTLKEIVKKKSEDFSRFFEQYVMDAVDAIAEIKPGQIGKRYIDRKLIDLVFNLEKVSYSGELRKLVDIHLDEKGDDHSFSMKCFEHLWQSNFGEMYPKMLEQFEFFLQQFFPRYRDHFIHQLQDFLLGTIILDHLLQNPEKWLGDHEIDIKKENLAKGWLLASSIHDFTYPLQEYDKWSKSFFIEQLSIKEPLSFLDLKRVYVEKTFLTRVEYLLSLLGKSFVNSSGGEDNTRLYNEVRRFFYYGIAEKKNHGLMSASYLLKRFEKKNDEEFSNVILPAAIACATHEDEIWQILSGRVNGDIKKKWGYIADVLGIKEKDIATNILDNSDINDAQKDREIADTLKDKKGEWIGNIYADISNIITKRPLFELYFEKQPLSFLLILCDNLQDWGRPCKDKELSDGMEAADIRLKDITFDVSSFILTIQLFFNDTEQSLGFMANKIEILKKISNFLKSKTIKFNVEFWDRENVRKKYSYKIGSD